MGCSASSFWDGWILVIRMWDVSKVVICIHRTPSLRCKQFWEIFFWETLKDDGKMKGQGITTKGYWVVNLAVEKYGKATPCDTRIKKLPIATEQIYTCEHFPQKSPPGTLQLTLDPWAQWPQGRCSARTRASNIPRRCQPMTSSLRQVVNFSVLWPSASRSWQSPNYLGHQR